MKICPSCNLENPDDVQRCQHCDADLLVTEADHREAVKLAWAQRYRLNELADRLEEQFIEHARPLEAKETKTWHGAIVHIAGESQLRADLITNVQSLVDHIRHNYPVDL
jgi:hypothetical protein